VDATGKAFGEETGSDVIDAVVRIVVWQTTLKRGKDKKNLALGWIIHNLMIICTISRESLLNGKDQ